jgi:hypothetical protein
VQPRPELQVLDAAHELEILRLVEVIALPVPADPGVGEGAVGRQRRRGNAIGRPVFGIHRGEAVALPGEAGAPSRHPPGREPRRDAAAQLEMLGRVREAVGHVAEHVE